MENYSFLSNYCSLIEIYTAIYVSMFIEQIIVHIWTPNYKQKISQLIRGMNIPAINYFVKKVEENIDRNATRIGNHMKRKAAFLFVFCLSLLLLAGLEIHSQVMHLYGYLIVTILSAVSLFFIVLGRWFFGKYTKVVFSILLYGVCYIFVYFSSYTPSLLDVPCLKSIDERVASCSFLLVVTLPIVWQMFIIWVYSRVYKGYMHNKISKEAYIYGKAYIAYKIRDMAALPKEYEMVARDFVSVQQTTGDTSLHSLNSILVQRLERLCEPPIVLIVFWSWIKYNLRGRHNREAEYIAENGFDYESMQANNCNTSTTRNVELAPDITVNHEDNPPSPPNQVPNTGDNSTPQS